MLWDIVRVVQYLTFTFFVLKVRLKAKGMYRLNCDLKLVRVCHFFHSQSCNFVKLSASRRCIRKLTPVDIW